jgi:hypothetical protein
VTERGRDCAIDPRLFRRPEWPVVIKTGKDAWATSPEFRSQVWAFLGGGGRSLAVGGLTATTCVREAVLSVLAACGTTGALLVARAPTRLALRPDAGGISRAERAFAAMSTAGALVISYWRAIRWSDTPTNPGG